MVDLIDPVWAATGDKATGDDFNDARKNQGFIAEQCSYQLMNAVIDRDETKINEICTEINAYLPTSDQKDAMDDANSPDTDNPFATINDLPYEFLNKYIFYDQFDDYMAVDWPTTDWLTTKWKYVIYDDGGSGGNFSHTWYNSGIRIETSDTANAYRYIISPDLASHENYAPKIKFSCDFGDNTDVYCRVGLYYDDNNWIVFLHNYAAYGSNWRGSCKDGGSHSMTSNYAADLDRHDFFIDVVNESSVNFYIDGNSVGEITTNIPSSNLKRVIHLATTTTANKNANFAYFYHRNDRS